MPYFVEYDNTKHALYSLIVENMKVHFYGNCHLMSANIDEVLMRWRSLATLVWVKK